MLSGDVYQPNDDLQDFPDAITDASCTPILPNLDELHYTTSTQITLQIAFLLVCPEFPLSSFHHNFKSPRVIGNYAVTCSKLS
jgi:hypothetical protein